MADDHNQRPFRTNDPYSRGAAPASSNPSGGNDPLAELARLIGQTDPFSEFGRDNARRAPAPPAVEQRPQPAAPAYAAPVYGAPGYHTSAPTQPQASPLQARDHQQTFPGFEHPAAIPQGYAGGNDQYRGGYDAQAHAPAQQLASGYDDDAYYQDQQPPEGDQDYYDEGPAPRRRIGVTAIAAILTLAVVGTAGAFGYRALFGSSGTPVPPPVIKADTTPSKIIPSSANDQKSGGKVIYDRVGDRSQDEKIVSREEAPVGINDKPTGIIAPPQESNGAATAAMQALAGDPDSTAPRKIHTIVIRPDQPDMGLPPPAAAAAPSAPPQAAPSPRVAATSRVASAQSSEAAPEVTPRRAPPQHVAQPAPPVRHAAATPSNAPLSLSPGGNADIPRSAPRAPVRLASAPSQTEASSPRRAASSAGAGHGGYVQISSQRSEADAQTAFRSLQGKYPKQLGGRQPVIRRADLGAKGVYYRALVGPFASVSEAAALCTNLKAAGGSCLIQRN